MSSSNKLYTVFSYLIIIIIFVVAFMNLNFISKLLSNFVDNKIAVNTLIVFSVGTLILGFLKGVFKKKELDNSVSNKQVSRTISSIIITISLVVFFVIISPFIFYADFVLEINYVFVILPAFLVAIVLFNKLS